MLICILLLMSGAKVGLNWCNPSYTTTG